MVVEAPQNIFEMKSQYIEQLLRCFCCNPINRNQRVAAVGYDTHPQIIKIS